MFLGPPATSELKWSHRRLKIPDILVVGIGHGDPRLHVPQGLQGSAQFNEVTGDPPIFLQ